MLNHAVDFCDAGSCVLNLGDCLHFGLACEKANALQKSPCGIIIAGDDVSVGKKGSMVGRRGLAGHVGSESRTHSL